MGQWTTMDENCNVGDEPTIDKIRRSRGGHNNRVTWWMVTIKLTCDIGHELA